MDKKPKDKKSAAADKKQNKDNGLDSTLASPVCYAGSDELRPEFKEKDEGLEQDEETTKKRTNNK